MACFTAESTSGATGWLLIRTGRMEEPVERLVSPFQALASRPMTDCSRVLPDTRRAMVHGFLGLAAEYFSCSIRTSVASVALRPPKYCVQSTPSQVSRGEPLSSRAPTPSTAMASNPSSFDKRRIACRVAHSSWKSSPVLEPRAPLCSSKFFSRSAVSLLS